MSHNDNSIYSKPLIFSVVAFVVIMIGTIVTTLYPVARDDMHPVLEGVKPYTALQLAGRDLYQREGCSLCHTQTIRPLKSEVLRYGDYSKAGESAFERPILWGSRRTGPDLARVGNKYLDEWHLQHFVNPQSFYPKSNMPKYYWFANNKLNAAEIEKHMKGLGFAYTAEEIAELGEKTELEAITAYVQMPGTAVPVLRLVEVTEEDFAAYGNPLKGRPEAIERGRKIFASECSGCHGMNGEGNIGMPLQGYGEFMEDPITFTVISNGYEGMMPGFINVMTMDQVASVMEYVRIIGRGNEDGQ